MKKYIIIVHVYDEENSQAYPLGGLFGSSISADKYLHEHVEEVKNYHWTKGRSEDEDGYDEEFTATGWTEDEIGVCERCGDYCPYEEMHNGLCDCCYGDMYG